MILNVNGKRKKVDVPPMKRLLDTLREDLGLTGTKEGCGEGECGACSVLIDGEVVNSCLVPTLQADGTKIVTVEGLAKKDKLHKLQKAFLDCGAAQCGICTPGMLVAACAIGPRPTPTEVREKLAGNLCRCTGYTKIFEAVEVALNAPQRVPKARARTTGGSGPGAPRK